ncbi:MAG: hypothetical protein WC365_02740 [Candidatus Babeliales bacterium]|jgi:hypothetical protein
MNKKRFFLMIFVVGALSTIALTWLFWPQQAKIEVVQEPASDSTGTGTGSAVTIKNITLREYEKKKGYELVVTAQESRLHSSSDLVECKGVTGSIVRHGERVAVVCAEQSVIDRPAHNILFKGTVHGMFKELEMYGADIAYDFATHMVTSDRTMTYRHPFFLLSAQQSIMNVHAQKIRLSKGVRSEFLYRAASNKSGD